MGTKKILKNDENKIFFFKPSDLAWNAPYVYQILASMSNSLGVFYFYISIIFFHVIFLTFRFPPKVARPVSFESERSVMIRQSLMFREPISQHLRVFGERLLQLNLEVTEGIYRGVVQGDDNSTALIFASDLMLNLLETAKSLRLDGTFDVSILGL